MSELFSPDYNSGTPELRVPEELRAPYDVPERSRGPTSASQGTGVVRIRS